MLVISQKDGDVIMVGETAIYLNRKGASGRMKVSIDAPTNIPIQRGAVIEEFLLANGWRKTLSGRGWLNKAGTRVYTLREALRLSNWDKEKMKP